jgi:epoxyqueuosine reductase
MGEAALPDSFKDMVRRRSVELGFSLCGFTTPDPPAHLTVYQSWLESGRQGQMSYLGGSRAQEARARPEMLLSGCRSVLVLAAPYPGPSSPPSSPLAGRVASYAQGDDYHDVLPPRLRALGEFIEQQVGRRIRFRACTDTSPLLERELAQRAGLGWIGKNTLLIHPRYGSYCFLAELLTDLPLPPDPPFVADRCGRCTRCLRACPTQCILTDRTLDARRCLSYLTIEQRGPLPPELRRSLGNWVFGCDLCQQVCPWNRRAKPPPADAHFQPRTHFPLGDLSRELNLDRRQAVERLRGSALRRARLEGYRRNACVALGNTRWPAAVPALVKALHDPLSLLRQHAAWALGQIGSAEAKAALTQALSEEGDPACQQEITDALEVIRLRGGPAQAG